MSSSGFAAASDGWPGLTPLNVSKRPTLYLGLQLLPGNFGPRLPQMPWARADAGAPSHSCTKVFGDHLRIFLPAHCSAIASLVSLLVLARWRPKDAAALTLVRSAVLDFVALGSPRDLAGLLWPACLAPHERQGAFRSMHRGALGENSCLQSS